MHRGVPCRQRAVRGSKRGSNHQQPPAGRSGEGVEDVAGREAAANAAAAALIAEEEATQLGTAAAATTRKVDLVSSCVSV
jgi:hypothetical protein